MGMKGFDDLDLSKARVLRNRLPGAEPVAAEGPQPTPRRNKYGARATIYGGVRYDSKAEAEYAATLDEMARAITGMWWIRQPTFRLGCPENVYRPDFLVFSPPAPIRVRVVDVKGVRTAKFNRDVRLWKAYGPCLLVIATRAGKGWKTEVIDPSKD
jgi:hypothetical protein